MLRVEDDCVWHLACAFAIVLNPEGRNLDVYKELARVDAIQSNMDTPDVDIVQQLREYGVKVHGPFGKIICTESGKWIFKRDSSFIRTPSFRGFFGKSFSFRRSSTASTEHSQVDNLSTPIEIPARSLSAFGSAFSFRHNLPATSSQDDANMTTPRPHSLSHIPHAPSVGGNEPEPDVPSNVTESTEAIGINERRSSAPSALETPNLETGTISSPHKGRRSLYASSSARTLGSARSGEDTVESGNDVYPPMVSVAKEAALLSLDQKCAIISNTILDEVTPPMIILELFYELCATWTGVGDDTVAADQRRMLKRVNSQAGLMRASSKLELIRLENVSPAPIRSPSFRSDGGMDPPDLNTELLNELLLDIAQNALDMPTVLDEMEQEKQNQLQQQEMLEKQREYDREAAEVKERDDRRAKIKEEKLKRAERKKQQEDLMLAARTSELVLSPQSVDSNDIVSDTATTSTARDRVAHSIDGSRRRIKDDSSRSTRSRSPAAPDDKSTGTGGKSERSSRSEKSEKASGGTGLTANVRFAPAPAAVPLRRPSWQSQVQPLYLTKKRRPSMAVRLALNEAGPFQKLLTEGVPVIIHFASSGSIRPRRVTRLMVLDDGTNNTAKMSVFDRKNLFLTARHSSDSLEDYDMGDRRSVTSDDKELGGSVPNTPNPMGSRHFHHHQQQQQQQHSFVHHQKLKFYKLESGDIKDCDGELVISDVCDIITGVHTIVFKQSLTQLHGEGGSFDKTGQEKRCFSMLMLSAKSPYDDRPVLDIEIQPMDKQKPEELQAAAMVSLGVATAIQIISNLENTTRKRHTALLQLFEKTIEDGEDDTNEINDDDDDHEDTCVDDEGNASPSGRRSEPYSMANSSSTDDKQCSDELAYNITPYPPQRPPPNGGAIESSVSNGTHGISVPTTKGLAYPVMRTAAGRGIRHSEEGERSGRGGRGGDRRHVPSGAEPLVLPPTVLAQFEGLLPSEKLTINCIMQDVVEMWVDDGKMLSESLERSHSANSGQLLSTLKGRSSKKGKIPLRLPSNMGL